MSKRLDFFLALIDGAYKIMMKSLLISPQGRIFDSVFAVRIEALDSRNSEEGYRSHRQIVQIVKPISLKRRTVAKDICEARNS
jgi:hypothetical protein